jgi:hypothetical protein
MIVYQIAAKGYQGMNAQKTIFSSQVFLSNDNAKKHAHTFLKECMQREDTNGPLYLDTSRNIEVKIIPLEVVDWEYEEREIEETKPKKRKRSIIKS